MGTYKFLIVADAVLILCNVILFVFACWVISFSLNPPIYLAIPIEVLVIVWASKGIENGWKSIRKSLAEVKELRK